MPSHLNDVFRQNVEALLESYGWTRTDLANQMGVTKGYISHVLGEAKRRGVGLEAVDKFAKALEVEPSDLIREQKHSTAAG